MEQDLKSIMELLQKGVITPEEAETMIKALNRSDSFTGTATKHAKNIGSKIGEGIDEVTPMMKSALKSCFEATATFSQKMVDKLKEEAQEEGMFEEEIFSEDEDFGFDAEETSEEIIDLVTKDEENK